MIIDNIKNAEEYFALNKDFEEALLFMRNCKDAISEPVILNERVTIKPASYVTRDIEECVFEAHKKYVDIHFVLMGTECIGYAPANLLNITNDDDEKDLILLEGNGTLLPLCEGDFMITYPQDAHMVAVRNGEKKPCAKLVAKIRL